MGTEGPRPRRSGFQAVFAVALAKSDNPECRPVALLGAKAT